MMLDSSGDYGVMLFEKGSKNGSPLVSYGELFPPNSISIVVINLF